MPVHLGPEQRGLARLRMERVRTGASTGWAGPARRLGALRAQPSNRSPQRKTRRTPGARREVLGAGGPGGVGQTHSCPDVCER